MLGNLPERWTPVTDPTADDLAVRRAFDEAMRNVYTRALREAGYNATVYLRMLTEHGPLDTARRLLASPTISAGFTALWEKGRLDLTVEAVVLRAEFQQFFTDEELDTARQRLEQLGYRPSR